MCQKKLNSSFTKQKSQQVKEFKAAKKEGLKREINSRICEKGHQKSSITCWESPSNWRKGGYEKMTA